MRKIVGFTVIFLGLAAVVFADTVDDQFALINEGAKGVRHDQTEEAIAAFTRAIELDAKDVYTASAYHKRGWIYARQDDYERAIADFSKAIGLDPQANYYFARGTTCLFAEKYKAALDDLTKAIDLDPDVQNGDAYYWRGDCYYLFDQNERAIADYTRYLKSKPDNGMALLSRGKALAAAGDTRAAREDFEKVLSLNGATPHDIEAAKKQMAKLPADDREGQKEINISGDAYGGLARSQKKTGASASREEPAPIKESSASGDSPDDPLGKIVAKAAREFGWPLDTLTCSKVGGCKLKLDGDPYAAFQIARLAPENINVMRELTNNPKTTPETYARDLCKRLKEANAAPETSYQVVEIGGYDTCCSRTEAYGMVSETLARTAVKGHELFTVSWTEREKEALNAQKMMAVLLWHFLNSSGGTGAAEQGPPRSATRQETIPAAIRMIKTSGDASFAKFEKLIADIRAAANAGDKKALEMAARNVLADINIMAGRKYGKTPEDTLAMLKSYYYQAYFGLDLGYDTDVTYLYDQIIAEAPKYVNDPSFGDQARKDVRLLLDASRNSRK